MKQTIEQLEGEIWGEPEFQSHLVTTCHRLRKKPIDDFTVEDLRIMVGQNIGVKYLLPLALDILETKPLVEGNFYQGDLLKAVIELPYQYWSDDPESFARMHQIGLEALKLLRGLLPQDTDESVDDLIRALEQFKNTNVG